MRYAMAIDTKKSVGCSDCVVACQTENNVPIGYCRDWIVEVTDGTYPQLEIEIRSERCNHCENSPCVRCCPTGASHYEDGGIVTVTPNECIGCGACVATCKNSSAMLFVSSKVSQLALLPQGKHEAVRRAKAMVDKMDELGFGHCTNTGACEVECPKGISLDHISRLNREFLLANLKP